MMRENFLKSLSLGLMLLGMECSAQTVSGNFGGHDYVDLGLSSGRLWATYNVGATKPEEYGSHFAWGETRPKSDYSEYTYRWSTADETGWLDQLLKYNLDGRYGEVDRKTVLDAADDAATANWGSSWRMPTSNEIKELIESCSWRWTSNFNNTGVAGRVGTSDYNGNTIFLPAAGNYDGTAYDYEGRSGDYWSSVITSESKYAYYLYVIEGNINCFYSNRYYGKCVRPVLSATASGVSTIDSQALQVYTESNGRIHVTHARANAILQVTDLDGKAVATTVTDHYGNSDIILPDLKSIYIVTVGNLSIKVVVK